MREPSPPHTVPSEIAMPEFSLPLDARLPREAEGFFGKLGLDFHPLSSSFFASHRENRVCLTCRALPKEKFRVHC